MGVAGLPFVLYVGNLQVLWGFLDRLSGCMLGTYRSCAAPLAPCVGNLKHVGPSFGLYFVRLQVLFGLLDRLSGCMLATYKSCGVAGPPLTLYVGNLQAVLWGLLDQRWQPSCLMVVAGPHLRLSGGSLQV